MHRHHHAGAPVHRCRAARQGWTDPDIGDLVEQHRNIMGAAHHHLVELQAEKRAKRLAAQEAKTDQVNKDTDWGKGEITDQTRNLVSNE